jgi:hypothetical protein
MINIERKIKKIKRGIPTKCVGRAQSARKEEDDLSVNSIFYFSHI